MIILDVSFGIFAFLPQGWTFMAFVIISECIIVSRILTKNWGNKRVYLTVGGANIASGLFGIIASMWMNGGWYLVVWFPWVSSNEVNVNNSEARNALIFFLYPFFYSLPDH